MGDRGALRRHVLRDALRDKLHWDRTRTLSADRPDMRRNRESMPPALRPDKGKRTAKRLSFFRCPSDRVRTCGLVVPNHPRCQLRYTRICRPRGLYTIPFPPMPCQAKPPGGVPSGRSFFSQSSRFLPQKNSATVPGPVWEPMTVPMSLMSTFPSSLGNRSSTSRATS